MADSKTKVAVFISGGGSNLQALIDAAKSGILDAEISLVVSSNAKAFGLERAEKENIKSVVYDARSFESEDKADDFLIELLEENKIQYIALAGYLKMISKKLIELYRDKLINIHPALLPKYGGKGMYGIHVHEAIVKNKDEESGATVHMVNEIYDEGKILAQKTVPVFPEDIPDELAARVLKIEHELYPETLDKLIKGKI